VTDLLYDPEGLEVAKERDRMWEALEREAESCTRCPLGAGRHRVVLGDGNRRSSLLLVGEGPGAEEDAQGIPFVGAAGQLLTKILEAAGIGRQEVYITNIVKCRPPNNRIPQMEEMLACDRFLQAQILLLNPRIIVCLGSTPAKWLLKTSEGISKIRGKWFSWRGIDVMPMFHPSYLLRNQSSMVGSPKHQTWLDIQEVRKRWDAWGPRESLSEIPKGGMS